MVDVVDGEIDRGKEPGLEAHERPLPRVPHHEPLADRRAPREYSATDAHGVTIDDERATKAGRASP